MTGLSIDAGPRTVPSGSRLRPADLSDLDEVIYEGTNSYAGPVDVERRLRWLAASAEHHVAANPVYARLAQHVGFSPDRLLETGDTSCIPLISSGTFKRRSLHTDTGGWTRACLSSGTHGSHSVIARDEVTMERFVGSVLHGLREFHGDTTLRQAFVLGPSAAEAGDIWFSYVLTLVTLVYDTDFFVVGGELRNVELYEALASLPPDVEPTIVAPPGLLVDFLTWMHDEHHVLELGTRNSYVVTAGGWKRREADAVQRPQLEAMITETLGIGRRQVRDVFNMVELNTVLFECEAARKHVPPWLVVSGRRPADMSVTDNGEVGVLSYLDPTPRSYPGFVLSDDLGSVDRNGCVCGRYGDTVSISRRLSTIEDRGCGLTLDRYAKA
jgi:long-chain-fatty-acid---luciferin-component ligase